jgi:hypothetical protein
VSRLKIIGELAKSGYTKFEYEGNFLHSSLAYRPATIRNLENELKIYSFLNESNNKFYMWSFIYEQIANELNWNNLDDSINFGKIQFYVNEDKFLIPEVESIDDIFNFNEQNTFTRPTINTIDNYLDLGDKKFIVSDAGILFSIHGKLEHKLLDFHNILSDEIKIILEKTLIGTLNTPFEITSCHLIPIDSGFWK